MTAAAPTPGGEPIGRSTLIFDADDTLWENNILFERVIDDYLEWLAHPTLDRDAIRAILNDIEAAHVVVHGYGTAVFLRCLAECLERLRARPASDQERREIEELAVHLIRHDVELMPGVAQALDQLAARHDLLLLTKGDVDEQQRKVAASGLEHHFSAVHIVPEKDEQTYRGIVVQHRLATETTWMIGNSPRSDILPARAAGLRAVFIPHPHTWVLEHSELDPADDGVLILGGFVELLQHF